LQVAEIKGGISPDKFLLQWTKQLVSFCIQVCLLSVLTHPFFSSSSHRYHLLFEFNRFTINYHR
jgi:hypothetical protein